MRHSARPDRFDILLHVGAFLLIAGVLWILIPGLLYNSDAVFRSVAASLGAGLAANYACARWFGSGSASDFGFGRTPNSLTQATVGFASGLAALSAIVLGAIATGFASWAPAEPGDLVAVTLALLAGAVGEELLFRGYAFQFLARTWPAPTIIGSGLLFGLAHVLLNQNIQILGAINTALWGCLLGYAFWRTQALWLPSGIHFGWNLAQVLLGVSLSGTTIRATGVRLDWSAGELWSGGAYGPEGGLLTTLAGGAMFLIVRRVR